MRKKAKEGRMEWREGMKKGWMKGRKNGKK